MNPSRRRLVFVTMLAAGGVVAAADPARKPFRVAFLSSSSPTNGGRSVESLRKAFRALGYADGPGGNLVIEARYAEGDPARYPGLAAELVAMKPDVIIAGTSSGVGAVRRATSTIPIVMQGVADPVGEGMVRSLARPGGNVTGITGAISDVSPKIVQIINAVAPRANRLGYLMRDVPNLQARLRELQDSAKRVGLSVVGVQASSAEEIESAFDSMARDRIGALIVSPGGATYFHRDLIVDLAAKSKIPAIYYNRLFVEAGGLVSYGPDHSQDSALIAGYVDKILRGAKPADLPVQQLDKFELVINLKTAKALGIRIPQELLVGATVIE